MDVLFANTRTRNDCNDPTRRKKRFGAERAACIRRRLSQLVSFDTLADALQLPQLRSELVSDTEMHVRVDDAAKIVLVFERANPNLTHVRSVTVKSIEVNHG